MKNIRYPLVKLPADAQVSLSLIREELKSRKLFHVLHKAGLEDCYFQPHLNNLILHSIGIDEQSDELYEAYEAIVEKRARKIEADNDSIMKQAMKVYRQLLELKKKLSAQ